jgi:hypothetical protein
VYVVFNLDNTTQAIEAVNLSLSTEGLTEKWDGFGRALPVAISGPGEILKQIRALHTPPVGHLGLEW